MLRTMLGVKRDVNIATYYKLKAFLKKTEIGYEPKKANVLNRNQIVEFVKEAPDVNYLMHKVALLMGICGTCRCIELVNLECDDIEDRGSVLVVKLKQTKTNQKRSFTVIGDGDITAIILYRKYAQLRARNISQRRFFYHSGMVDARNNLLARTLSAVSQRSLRNF